jgi:DNA-binding FadR family transcriptional regulator
LAEKQKIRNESSLRLHQSVAQQMGIAILSGVHKPGEHFAGEIEQSAAMGVSRTAYREAIRILTAKGLLESKPKAGTHVTPRKRWNLLDPDMLAWMFMGTPDEQFIRDLFELRNLLEPAAAKLAAERRTAEQLGVMQAAIADMRAYGLATTEGQAADQRFHATLLAASGNQALATLASSVGAAVQWTTNFKQRANRNPRDPLPEHIAVCDAIKAGNAAQAFGAMETLIDLAFKDMAFAR